MVEIRLKTLAAGPSGCFSPGVIRVSEDEAKALVDGGYAEYIAVPKLIEATTIQVPEKAVMPEPKKRKPGR